MGWYEPTSHGVSVVAPLVETKWPGVAELHGPFPVVLKVPAMHTERYPVNDAFFPDREVNEISSVSEAAIESVVNSLSKSPPGSSIVAAGPLAPLTRIDTVPCAGATADST